MPFVYRCRHTGGYYPLDYYDRWGKDVGVGLGPKPVSESLNTDYQGKPVPCGQLGDCHPVGNSYAELDLVSVSDAEYEKGKLILHKDDPDYRQRMQIIREKQRRNPLSKLPDKLAA